jgi:hypothetical protein
MTSSKQRAANRANALKSTGPKSELGRRRAAVNATQHGLSLPIDTRIFKKEIAAVTRLIRDECESDDQATELAKRIIDFERNEAYLMKLGDESPMDELKAWTISSPRMQLNHLIQTHRNKERATITFTTTNKKPKGKERTDEIKFIEDFIKLQDKVLLGKVRSNERKLDSSVRYQKRSINQLVKGVRIVASGEEF